MRKKIWKSAVAHGLVQHYKREPPPSSLIERMTSPSKRNPTPPELAANLARRLLQSFATTRGLHQAPNLELICSSIGLAVVKQPLVVDALLQPASNGYIAILNSTNSLAKQRFSLAHEIGHLELFKRTGLHQAFGHIDIKQRTDVDSREVEELCDYFASELLMPTEFWQDLIDDEGLSLTTLQKLRAISDVSFTRAARRLTDIANVECAIILWEAIREDSAIVGFNQLSVWQKSNARTETLNHTLYRTDELLKAGSPFHAMDQQALTTGRISLSLNRRRERFLAQSTPLDKDHAITILLPESSGHVMFPAGN